MKTTHSITRSPADHTTVRFRGTSLGPCALRTTAALSIDDNAMLCGVPDSLDSPPIAADKVLGIVGIGPCSGIERCHCGLSI